MRRSVHMGLGMVLLLAVVGWVVAADTRPADTPKTIKVSTAEELIAAIGPDRVLELQPGKYILSDVADRKMEFIRWDKVFDGKNVSVRKVKGLKIVGVGKEPVHLITATAYANVLGFEDCQEVVLENVVLGHAPEKGYCTNGVIGLQNCRGMTLRKCDLYGCGTEGLTVRKSQNVLVEDSIIRDCSYGMMTVEESKGVSVRRTQLHDNEKFYGVQINDSEDVTFTDCAITKNNAGEAALVEVVSSSNVVLKDCTITDNRAAALTDNPKTLKVEGGKVERNQFVPKEKE